MEADERRSVDQRAMDYPGPFCVASSRSLADNRTQDSHALRDLSIDFALFRFDLLRLRLASSLVNRTFLPSIIDFNQKNELMPRGRPPEVPCPGNSRMPKVVRIIADASEKLRSFDANFSAIPARSFCLFSSANSLFSRGMANSAAVLSVDTLTPSIAAATRLSMIVPPRRCAMSSVPQYEQAKRSMSL